MKGANASGVSLHHVVDEFAGAISGPVVHRHHHHAVKGVVHPHQVFQTTGNYRFFVVGGDQHRDPWPVGTDDAGVGVALRPKQAAHGEQVVAQRVHGQQGQDGQRRQHQTPGPHITEGAAKGKGVTASRDSRVARQRHCQRQSKLKRSVVLILVFSHHACSLLNIDCKPTGSREIRIPARRHPPRDLREWQITKQQVKRIEARTPVKRPCWNGCRREAVS